jgi:mevalonate kinase
MSKPDPALRDAVSASAPGKIILFGEHAVVYGRPAIAVPVSQVQATATIAPHPSGVVIRSIKTGESMTLDTADPQSPLVAIVRLTLAAFNIRSADLALTVDSSIPIAGGLGSGAAVSVAIVRALARWYRRAIDDETVSTLAYEVERLHHGTPSGIDNTVIAYQRPVYFVRGEPIRTFNVARPFSVAIANTGRPSLTKIAVGDVRRGWEAQRDQYEAWFDQIGAIVRQARAAIESGANEQLGPLMDHNQALLRHLEVSSPELERLIAAAKHAGAAGAKLVGGGRGGNLIALVDERNRDEVAVALREAGATDVIVTGIQ